MEQLRFFAAGSFGNFIVAAISLAIVIFAFSPMSASNGVALRTLPGYPAQEANLTGYIVSINNYAVNSTTDLSNVLGIIGPNKTVDITTVNITGNATNELRYVLETAPEPQPKFKPDAFTDIAASIETILHGAIDFMDYPPWAPQTGSWSQTSYYISKWGYIGDNYPALKQEASDKIAQLTAELGNYPRRGYIGVLVADVKALKPEFAPYSETITFFGGLFSWLFLLNLGVGAFNLLPMKPLDGERMWRIVVQRFAKKKGRASKIMDYVSIAVLFLILAFFALVFM